MKKIILLTISIFTFSIAFSQIEKEPILRDLIDLSIEGEKAFLQFQTDCDSFFESKNKSFDSLTEVEETFQDSCYSMKENYCDLWM